MEQRTVGWCETVQEETELTLEYPSEQDGLHEKSGNLQKQDQFWQTLFFIFGRELPVTEVTFECRIGICLS